MGGLTILGLMILTALLTFNPILAQYFSTALFLV